MTNKQKEILKKCASSTPAGNLTMRSLLQDLFRLREDSLCCTHDLLGCECGDPGNAQTPVSQDPVVVSRPCQLQTGPPSATPVILSTWLAKPDVVG